MIKHILSTTLMAFALFMIRPVSAQWVTNTGGTYTNYKVGIGGFLGNGGLLPQTDLEVRNSSPTLRIGSVNLTDAPNYTPTSTLQFGQYSGTSPNITFNTGFTMSYATFNGCGSGRFSMNNGQTGITFFGDRIGFGTMPVSCGGYTTVGQYTFGGMVGAPSLLIGNGYTPPATAPTIPSGYLFSVNGKSEFKDKVVVGNDNSFTNGFPSGFRLYVKDGILTERVKVAIANTSDWADYVFDKEYRLMPIYEVKAYIEAHKHLPEVPSAEEVANGGIDVAKMDATLLKKIEELTLYMIELKKENEEMKDANKALQQRIEVLENQ